MLQDFHGNSFNILIFEEDKKSKRISYGEHTETQGNLICIKTIGFLQAKPVSNTILTSSIFLHITTYIK